MKLAMVGPTLLVVLLSFSSAAQACRGQACDRQDPVVEGCDRDAVTLETKTISSGGRIIARVKLLWSPSCQTNWARVYSSSRMYLRARIRIHDFGPGHYNELYWPEVGFQLGTNTWTDMFYCPTGECEARAYGYAKTSSNGTTVSSSTGWY